MRKGATLLFLLSLVSFCFGCGMRKVVRVDPPYPSDLSSAKKRSADIKDADTKEKRNAKINDLLLIMDQNFREYKNVMYVTRSGFDTLHDFAILSLTGATALTGTAETKSMLGAISTGLVGAKTSVDKNFFANQARDALFVKMESLRETRLVTILEHESKPLNEYSMEMAFRELDSYYEAGTALQAMESINIQANTDTAAAKVKQQTALDNLIK